jgi:hypothetical protein
MASKIIVDQLEKSGYTTLTLPSANATANQYIKNDGTGSLSWATLPTTIGEVTGVNLATTISTTSTSYVASGLTITITPDSSSSRFLLFLSGGEQGNTTNSAYVYTTFYVDTGSGAAEVSPAGPYESMRQEGLYSQTVFGPHSALCLHSPATASAVTYAVYYKSSAGTASFNVAASRVQFTVMELSS